MFAKSIIEMIDSHSFKNVSAMVTLYNSEYKVIDRISTYIKQVSKLYVVDNSEQPDDDLIQKILLSYPTVEYISNKGNQGIAHALNVGAQAALRDGYKYLLTMDDDSQASKGMLNALLDYIEKHDEPNKIGIVAAQSDPNLYGNDAEEVWFTITSGSLLSMSAYRQCGIFQEDLFIDAVDHEYCFRLIEAGYKIVSLNYLHLTHRIGELKRLKIFNKTLYKWASHNPVRNYYMLRNFLYVINKYKKVIPNRTKLLLIYGLTKVCVLNSMLEKDTLVRLRYMSKAVSDFRKNKLGKLPKTATV